MNNKITPTTTLNEYLRDHLHLTGTKKMCYEGSCGACVVAVLKPDPITGIEKLMAINSCLVSIFTCHGWHIDTIEGISDPTYKNHVLQETLIKFNGSQCGFCSPGMIMNMYPLYENNKDNLTISEVENSFSGNICRCTGYRPILTAFKSLCKDASCDLLKTYEYVDIEDCAQSNCKIDMKLCRTSRGCPKLQPLYVDLADSNWTKVFLLKDLLDVLKNIEASSYMLVAGNTAKGVYPPNTSIRTYIDIIEVKELVGHEITDDGLVLRANVSLNDTVDLFRSLSKSDQRLTYLEKLATHINLVANVPVRNIGTLAGNLMIKHQHNEFPSDIFLLCVTVGAYLIIIDANANRVTKNLEEFLDFDMSKKVIEKISFPFLSKYYDFQSYKIMPRAENVLAIVNAGFLFKFKNNLVEKATIVYGNINPSFIHAKNTEEYLNGTNLFHNTTLQRAFEVLSEELKPDYVVPEASPEYRKELAVALFYKAVLSIAPQENLLPSIKSGGTLLERPISHGFQDYETNRSLYPLTQPIAKLEALAQATGKAQFITDQPKLPHQLYAKLIFARCPPNSRIEKIDASKALALKEVVAFYTKDDIPGENNFMPKENNHNINEEIFCDGLVKYFGQPVGVLVSDSENVLPEASNLVKISYSESKYAPLLSIKDVLDTNAKENIFLKDEVKATRKGNNTKHVISGKFELKSQYHYHMELQACNVVPTENGLDMFTSTQCMDLAQVAASNMLNIPNSKINVKVRRLGGGFGGKQTRNSLISCATALPAWKLRKPVRMSLTLEENMIIIGKRLPFYANYELGVDDKGVIQYLNVDMYSDVGAGGNDITNFRKVAFKAYVHDTYNWKHFRVNTDTHANTFCRGPGSVECFSLIESIMDHIAYELILDPINVRFANTAQNTYFNQLYYMTTGAEDESSKVRTYLKDMLHWGDIYKRKKIIDTFNKENRWKKKGISVTPILFTTAILGPITPISVHVSIFHSDGTVCIIHGGIEMGQGINTKAAQVCAYKLGIPLKKVLVTTSAINVCPNGAATAASWTSEGICSAIIEACDTLLERMGPYNPTRLLPWDVWTQLCLVSNVLLSAEGSYSPTDPKAHIYSIYGVSASEVTVDILTGQYIVDRVDIIEDTGRSINPNIDLGQVEGAFVFGLGYFTMENIIFTEQGQVATNNSWTYWPPGAKDIPVDFRVKFPKNNPNPVGVLLSKATGEIATTMAISVPLAIRNAVASARAEADNTKPKWYPFDGPSSVENTFINCLNNYSKYILK